MKGFVCSAIVCTAAVLCAMATSIAVGQPAPASRSNFKMKMLGPRQPGGVLGDHLGNYLTIEGVPLDVGKVEAGTLLVDTVGGKKLDKPIPVLIRNFRLPTKQRCVLKGYESGGMIGTAQAVYAAAKEQGRNDVAPSQVGFRWRPYFVALIVVEPRELEPPTQ